MDDTTVKVGFIDCHCQEYTIKAEVCLQFEIWDTAGQERYHSLAPMYYRGAQAAIVVYDITNADTFERAKSWVKELQRQVWSLELRLYVLNTCLIFRPVLI